MTEKIDVICSRHTRNFSGDDLKSFKIIRGTVSACTSNINKNSATVPAIDYTLHTLHFAPCKRIQDSPGFRIPDYKWWTPDSLSVELTQRYSGGRGEGSLSSTTFPGIFPPLPFSEGKIPGSEVVLN